MLLTEYVRQAVRRKVVKPYLNAAGDLPAFFIDPSLEQLIESAVEHTENMSHLNLAPQRVREILDKAMRFVGTPDTPVVPGWIWSALLPAPDYGIFGAESDGHLSK